MKGKTTKIITYSLIAFGVVVVIGLMYVMFLMEFDTLTDPGQDYEIQTVCTSDKAVITITTGSTSELTNLSCVARDPTLFKESEVFLGNMRSNDIKTCTFEAVSPILQFTGFFIDFDHVREYRAGAICEDIQK